MATKLPRPTRLKVEEALARYSDWAGVPTGEPVPEPVCVLGNNANNLSVLIANHRRFVLRVNRHRRGHNALDPVAEEQALRRAAAAGLAPPLRYCDTARGILVSDYLPPDANASISVAALAGVLRRIHALPAIDATLSLPDRIRHYESLLHQAVGPETAMTVLGRYSERASNCAHSLQNAADAQVLCHNDLLPQNVLVSGGRLWAIDWEYAAMGSRWFDIAVAGCGAGLEGAEADRLLEAYLQRPPRAPERDLLRQARVCYRYIERLWYACNQPVESGSE